MKRFNEAILDNQSESKKMKPTLSLKNICNNTAKIILSYLRLKMFSQLSHISDLIGKRKFGNDKSECIALYQCLEFENVGEVMKLLPMIAQRKIWSTINGRDGLVIIIKDEGYGSGPIFDHFCAWLKKQPNHDKWVVKYPITSFFRRPSSKYKYDILESKVQLPLIRLWDVSTNCLSLSPENNTDIYYKFASKFDSKKRINLHVDADGWCFQQTMPLKLVLPIVKESVTKLRITPDTSTVSNYFANGDLNSKVFQSVTIHGYSSRQTNSPVLSALKAKRVKLSVNNESLEHLIEKYVSHYSLTYKLVLDASKDSAGNFFKDVQNVVQMILNMPNLKKIRLSHDLAKCMLLCLVSNNSHKIELNCKCQHFAWIDNVVLKQLKSFAGKINLKRKSSHSTELKASEGEVRNLLQVVHSIRCIKRITVALIVQSAIDLTKDYGRLFEFYPVRRINQSDNYVVKLYRREYD